LVILSISQLCAIPGRRAKNPWDRVQFEAMPLTVIEHVREDGSIRHGPGSTVLPAQAVKLEATARLEMGNTSAVEGIGVIGEYRIDWCASYRLYFAKDGADIVTLLGGEGRNRPQFAENTGAILWSVRAHEASE
jgi:putative component of toxin-antitoxin plasmid stabilization module